MCYFFIIQFQAPFGTISKPRASATILCKNYNSLAPQPQHLPPPQDAPAAQVPAVDPSLPDGTFRANEIEITLTPPFKLRPKPDVGNLIFGRTFSDHMFTVEWDKATGWTTPKIKPMENLQIHPAAKVLHYAIEVSVTR